MPKIKRKILLISCKGLGKGGVQAVIMSIVRKLSHEFTFDIILFTKVKGYYEEEFESYGGKIYRIPLYEGKNSIRKLLDFIFCGPKIFSKTKKIINKSGPYCAIHCNNYYESAFCLKAAYKKLIPVRICHIHDCVQPSNIVVNKLREFRLRVINKYATRKVACSDDAYYSVFKNDVTSNIILNSFNSEVFSKSKYPKVETGKLVFTQVGSFSAKKNQLFSINLISHLKKHLSDVTLNLVGFDVDNYKCKLVNEIDHLSLEKNVHFYPSDTNIPKLLSQTTISIVPSLFEGFGIVAIESQAMGVPVFASEALPKTTNAGGCTYLSLDLGPEAWAKHILAWYKENQNKTFDFDCEKYEENYVIQKYKELYEGEKQS